MRLADRLEQIRIATKLHNEGLSRLQALSGAPILTDAIGTILDANITTFVAAAILFAMGSGPVKGFAVTLAIGIITSVFTAVFLTRMILVIWLRRTRPQTLPI